MEITFQKATADDIPQLLEWIEQPYLKRLWPLEDYGSTPKAYFEEMVAGNGYDFPFIIIREGKPIGYIQYCDLKAYQKLCENPKGVKITRRRHRLGPQG